MAATVQHNGHRAGSNKRHHHKPYRPAAAPRSGNRSSPSSGSNSMSKLKMCVVCSGTLILALFTLAPVILLESGVLKFDGSDGRNGEPQSLHEIMARSRHAEREFFQTEGVILWNKAKDSFLPHTFQAPLPMQQEDAVSDGGSDTDSSQDGGTSDTLKRKVKPSKAAQPDQPYQPPPAPVVAKNLPDTTKSSQQQNLARGVSGLPMSQTPALIGASRGHIECDVDVDDLAYWNDPQGKRDREFQSPFAATPGKYLTFEPDCGGWNNIRMSMEIIFVLAAATGRTLVLPPKVPMYLLGMGAENAKSFGNFFPLDHPEFQNRVQVITMSEFMKREGSDLLGLTDAEKAKLSPVAEMCLHQKDSDLLCDPLYEKLRAAGLQPQAEAGKNCFIFDEGQLSDEGSKLSTDAQERVNRFCGEDREALFYDQNMRDTSLIHWDAGSLPTRLLTHFYEFVFFTDPVIDNHFKRFVRDFLRYKDPLYCAAGKIVHALNQEGEWSSLHIRRGDLQYKKVKISAQEWYNNTQELWHKKEILFIATDERNKTFFEDLRAHHELRFLDDYWDMAKLGELDSNFLGMIDTIVASHGRVFAGTWFSTFSAYITRLRGYVGHSLKTMWYGWLPRKDVMQKWLSYSSKYAREYPIGWVAIDGDKIIEHEPETSSSVVYDEEEMPEPPEQAEESAQKLTVSKADFDTDEGFSGKSPARGDVGKPYADSPVLIGAKRPHMECDINVDSLAYWNDPQGPLDQNFESPFAVSGEEKYITFSVDTGGWNNVRMSMEIIFAVAAATGRTLVLPPKEPLYRLRADKGNIHRGFADFFPLETKAFANRLKTISMEEFVKREGGPNGRATIPDDMRKGVLASAAHCDKRQASESFCQNIYKYLDAVAYPVDAAAKRSCVVFDKELYNGEKATAANDESISHFCGKRDRFDWTSELNDHPVIHFRAGTKEWRLLTHFYSFLHFTDPAVDNHIKRFIRDFLHYNDQIYCAAGKIVKALQAEGKKQGFSADEHGAGGYSAMHIRRGELQYQKVKIPAEEWIDNTEDVWEPKEILYMATDERNKTWFDPIGKNHDLRFLDDYWDLAGLDDLDPNYFGMIDTIVASRGRAFAGTFFSTFSGYINRMRGYHGITMKESYYSFLDRKTKMHEWEDVDHYAFAYEWPAGWAGIDSEKLPSKDVF